MPQIALHRRSLYPAALVTLGLLCLAFLASLVDAVPEHDSWTSVDPHVASWFAAHRTPSLDSLALHLGTATAPLIITALVALASVFIWRRGQRAEAVLWTCSVLGALVITYVVKAAVDRPRPLAPLNLTPETEPSFPSGHVLAISTAVFAALLLLWPTLSRRARIVGSTVGGVAVLAVCADRLVIDAHWLTDVLASLALAVVLACGAALAAILWNRRTA